MFRGKMFPEARFNIGQEKAKQRNVFRVAWYKETSFNRKGSNKKKKKEKADYGNRGDKAILSGDDTSLRLIARFDTLPSLILEFPCIRLTPDARDEQCVGEKKKNGIKRVCNFKYWRILFFFLLVSH